MRHLAGINLTEPQFQALSGICEGDPQFPQQWDLWQAFAAEATRIASSAGEPVPEVKVDPVEFKAWCGQVRVMPGLDALQAYAILARRRLLADA